MFPLADPREEHCLIDGPGSSGRLFLRRLGTTGPRVGVVVYVHGATFPSASSIAWRFDGRAWRDALNDAGFTVWGLDFAGFGFSDRPPEMDRPADAAGPLLLAVDAALQLEAAVRHVVDREGCGAVSLIAHSWGSMPAGLFAAAHPMRVDRIVLFAPLASRAGPRYVPRPTAPAWRIVTVEDQWKRFGEDVPAHVAPVLTRERFDAWADAWLATDPDARGREPPGVKTPTGPLVEILRAWHGELAWEPGDVRAPVAIVRGAWDGLCTDADAGWLFERLSRSTERRDVKIAGGTHLMHLEAMRAALWDESIAFLRPDRPDPHRRIEPEETRP